MYHLISNDFFVLKKVCLDLTRKTMILLKLRNHEKHRIEIFLHVKMKSKMNLASQIFPVFHGLLLMIVTLFPVRSCQRFLFKFLI